MAIGLQSEQYEFIKKIASTIAVDASSYGFKVISPIIAQAIIESNWGKSGLATLGKNLFGIKCGSSWKGASINMNTKEEYSPGTLTSISANFRKYESWEDSIHDYFKFTSTKRYAKLKDCATPLDYCTAIKDAGYATSSAYVKTLMDCINVNDLTQLDKFYNEGKLDFIAETKPVEATPVVEVKPEEPKDNCYENVTSVIDYTKVVTDVIKGVYGSGNDRILRLANNGFNPMAVQYMVNLQCKINDLTEEKEIYYNIIQKIKEDIKL